MDNKKLIALSILAAKDSQDLPAFSALDSEVSKIIIDIVKCYDFTQSQDFISKTDGKSEAFTQRLLDSIKEPTKARKLKDAFLQSIRDIETSDEVFGFVSPDDARKIGKLRRLLAGDAER